MKDFLTAIQTKDRHSLQKAVEMLTSNSEVTADELLEVLLVLPLIVAAFPKQFIWEDKAKKIIWHDYEGLIWDIGEAFRQALKHHTALRKDSQLFGGFIQVALNPLFGKGRESFVMLLGQYGNREVISTLKQLLDDPEVQGHAVYALRLLGAPEVQNEIRPFLHSPKTWVRNEAKKYFQKLEKQQA